MRKSASAGGGARRCFWLCLVWVALGTLLPTSRTHAQDEFSSQGCSNPHGCAHSSHRTGTQTNQPSDPPCNDPGPWGCPRGNPPNPGGSAAGQGGNSGGTSVHCQIEEDNECHCGPRRGTGRNRPCIPTPGPRPTPSPRRAQGRRIFNYYYINGINTPLDGPGRGTYRWDRRLIEANLLDLAPRVGQAPQRGGGYDTRVRVADEVDVLGPETYNLSGKQQALSGLLSTFCDTTKAGQFGIATGMADALCQSAAWIDAQRAGSSLAPGDVVESFRQALETFPGATGIAFAADSVVARDVAGRILKTYVREQSQPPESRDTNYFIVVGHSQGNFFTEGVAYRLQSGMDTDGKAANYIFHNRLGLMSLASPTDYNSLPPDFRDERIAHLTRHDDAITMLRAFGGKAKKPWPPSDDVEPLWPWQPDKLEAALKIIGPGNQSPALTTMGIQPPPACACPSPDDALYVPLMNSHLLDNYLSDSTLTEPGRALNPQAARTMGLPGDRTPPTKSVLRHVRFGLFQLKQKLLGN